MYSPESQLGLHGALMMKNTLSRFDVYNQEFLSRSPEVSCVQSPCQSTLKARPANNLLASPRGLCVFGETVRAQTFLDLYKALVRV